jgi:hypothetical protein
MIGFTSRSDSSDPDPIPHKKMEHRIQMRILRRKSRILDPDPNSIKIKNHIFIRIGRGKVRIQVYSELAPVKRRRVRTSTLMTACWIRNTRSALQFKAHQGMENHAELHHCCILYNHPQKPYPTPASYRLVSNPKSDLGGITLEENNFR